MPRKRPDDSQIVSVRLPHELIRRLDRYLDRLGAFELDLTIGTKGFNHSIETLSRPWHQLPKPMDGDPIMAFAETVIGALKLLTLGLRL